MWVIKIGGKVLHQQADYEIQTVVKWVAKRFRLAQRRLLVKPVSMEHIVFFQKDSGEYLVTAYWEVSEVQEN